MKASEKIKNLDPEHMSDLMHADADEHSNVGEGPNLFVAYLDRDYPNLLAFLFQAMEEMPFADDDKAMQFMVGATFATAAICRAIEVSELPSID